VASELPHILVVDDDTRLRTLLRKYLSDSGFRVSTAGDAAEARAQLASLSFDLIVLDVMMPGESGFDFVTSLRPHSKVPILLLTAMGESEHRVRGFETGADDYLHKPFEPRELVLRIQSILRRVPAETQVTKPAQIRLGPFRFDVGREQLLKGSDVVRLTSAEIGLLKVLAENAGEPLSREELGERCAIAGGLRAVDVQVTRLRRKIEPDPKLPRYLRTVRGRGYVLRPD
jgi:two-component system, OmpR family, phosphate regulon response regulator OmpR